MMIQIYKIKTSVKLCVYRSIQKMYRHITAPVSCHISFTCPLKKSKSYNYFHGYALVIIFWYMLSTVAARVAQTVDGQNTGDVLQCFTDGLENA